MMANNNINNNNEDMATMKELIEMKDFLEKAINHISKSEDEKEKDNFDNFSNYLSKAENEISRIAYFKSVFESSPIVNPIGISVYYITFNALTDKYQADECKIIKPAGVIFFNSKTIAELCADWLNFAREHERSDNCKT